MAEIGDRVRAASLAEVIALIDRTETNPRILAGGTDLLLPHVSDPSETVTLIDITGVEQLAEIRSDEDGVSIGAAVKLSDIVRSTVLVDRLPILVWAAAEVAGPQIRNLATIGGNVCNASPSADTVPPLLVLDAQAEYVSGDKAHSVPLSDFFIGPGETILGSDGLLTALRIAWPSSSATGVYLKHSPRQAMDLAIVGVAVMLDPGANGLTARIALGAVGPTPLRATAAEASLRGLDHLTDESIHEAARLAEEAAAPIDDVRGSARYRRDMVRRLVGRALRVATNRLTGDEER